MRCRIDCLLLALILLVTGCASPPDSIQPTGSSSTQVSGLEEQAAREATEMISQARATALILQAQGEARAVLDEALRAPTSQETAEPVQRRTPSPEKSTQEPGDAPLETDQPGGNDKEYRIELFDISYAAEGGFIIVRFHATRTAADDIWPGRVSVVDEATGSVYDEVPVMPVIGPLIGRPRSIEQLGYVMLTNTAPGLPPGSFVTVKLGKFTQNHVEITR